jgi:hypothetical protein
VGKLRELLPGLIPWAEWLYRVAAYNGLKPTVTSVYRSPEKQAVLYDRWVRGQSDIPAAPPGRSLHQHRRAFDLVVSAGYHSPQQAWLGSVWNSVGGTWHASDPVHFQG